MRGWLSFQYILIPFIIVCAAGFYPALTSFSVDRSSPIFTTETAARHWVDVTTRTEQCRPDTTIAEALAEYNGLDSPWYGRVRCSRHRPTLELMALVTVPWLILNLIFLLLTRTGKR